MFQWPDRDKDKKAEEKRGNVSFINANKRNFPLAEGEGL